MQALEMSKFKNIYEAKEGIPSQDGLSANFNGENFTLEKLRELRGTFTSMATSTIGGLLGPNAAHDNAGAAAKVRAVISKCEKIQSGASQPQSAKVIQLRR
tara:strand:+ start:1678 stop:1980 length:303 start_codon:yes stop_codon:yes gene_type:complete